MKISNFYFLIITIVISSTIIFAQKKLSLPEVISIALTQNTSLKKSVNNIDATSEAIKTAYEGVSKVSFDKMHYRTDIAKKAFKNSSK